MNFSKSNFNKFLVLFIVLIVIYFFNLDSTSCDPLIVKKLGFLEPHKILNQFPCYKKLIAMKYKYVICNITHDNLFWILTHRPKELAVELGAVDAVCNSKIQFMNVYPHMGHAKITLLQHVDIQTVPCLEYYHDQISEVINNEGNIKNAIDIKKQFTKDLSYVETHSKLKANKDFMIFVESLKKLK
jgi:hypothetical protein